MPRWLPRARLRRRAHEPTWERTLSLPRRPSPSVVGGGRGRHRRGRPRRSRGTGVGRRPRRRRPGPGRRSCLRSERLHLADDGPLREGEDEQHDDVGDRHEHGEHPPATTMAAPAATQTSRNTEATTLDATLPAAAARCGIIATSFPWQGDRRDAPRPAHVVCMLTGSRPLHARASGKTPPGSGRWHTQPASWLLGSSPQET